MTQPLDRQCRACGQDEWYRHRSGAEECAPCQRTRVRGLLRIKRRDLFFRMLETAKERARQYNIPFTITRRDLAAVMTDRCPVFGAPWGRGRWKPSLDRLDPIAGYVPGNIAVISVQANMIKSDATAEQVLNVGRWMQRQGL